MARVRLIDIAQAAGVSMTTASYVVNHRPVAIPQETRRRILQIADDLDYRPNRIARNLAQRTSGLIGVLTPMNGSPFHARLTAELNEHAAARSLNAVFEPAVGRGEGGLDPQDAVDRLRQWRIDGLLLWCDETIYDVVADCPIVSMGPTRGLASERRHILIDLYSGARSAAQHLLALGHREICFVGHHGAHRDPRWIAACDVMVEAGLPPPSRLERLASAVDLRSAAARLATVGKIPSAFLCISDLQATEVFRGLRDAHLSVPRDASIASCDETWAAENFDPPLTAISIPFGEMTKLAFDTLLHLIRGDPLPVDFPRAPFLNVRGSTAAPRLVGSLIAQ